MNTHSLEEVPIHVVRASTEALTFEVLDDLILAHERGRVPAVRLALGACLGAVVELLQFVVDHEGALPYQASEETHAIQRAHDTGRPVYLNDGLPGFVPARRAPYGNGDFYWDAFMLKAYKAIVAADFPSSFGSGLVGAMDEMQNNIHDHSQSVDTGLIAYRVSDDRVEWVVADRGIGVLAGLRAGAFPRLVDSGDALRVALTDGGSRFGASGGRGYGFRELFKAMSARHGSLRFRSDDQALTIRGVSPLLSSARLQQRANVRGFCVTVICTKPTAAKLG